MVTGSAGPVEAHATGPPRPGGSRARARNRARGLLRPFLSLAVVGDRDRDGDLLRRPRERRARAHRLQRARIELRLAAALDHLQALGADLTVAEDRERHLGGPAQAGAAALGRVD